MKSNQTEERMPLKEELKVVGSLLLALALFITSNPVQSFEHFFDAVAVLSKWAAVIGLGGGLGWLLNMFYQFSLQRKTVIIGPFMKVAAFITIVYLLYAWAYVPIFMSQMGMENCFEAGVFHFMVFAGIMTRACKDSSPEDLAEVVAD